MQQQPQGPVQTLQGKNFTQALQVNYTANIQNNQGTQQVYGSWVQLYNPSTQFAGFMDFYAGSTDALKAAEPDTVNMLASIM